MKRFPSIFGFGLVLLCGGSSARAQVPPKPEPSSATQPAKPPVVAPAPANGKQVDVPELPKSGTADASDSETKQSKAPVSSNNSAMSSKDRRGPYIIGPEDVLLIRVWQEPNLSGQVVVGPDGMISLQLIDEVRAEGLSPDQLKRVLTEKLKAFIVDPDVNVQVQRVNSRKFFIQGEVLRPGTYPLTGPTTIMEALVSAAGFREFANTKKIYLLRTEVDAATKKSEVKKYTFNYKDVSHGKHMEQNILVLNGDQIFVP